MVEVLNFFCRSRNMRKALEQRRTRLYRVAYSWCHNAALADDLVQETLTKAMQKASQLRDHSAADAWLFTILSNCFRDHHRRSRETEDIDNVQLINETTPEGENSQQQTIHRVRSAIANLAEGQRQVITLVDLEGFSYVEVANILDIPIGTVMSRLSRARKALRGQLIQLFRDEHNAEDASQNTSQEARLRRVK